MFEHTDPRKEKHLCRRMGLTATFVAYEMGCENGYRRKPRPNPYPKGIRHDEFNRGQAGADPKGEYMGRNV